MAKYTEFDFNTPITDSLTLTGQWACGGYDPSNPTIEGVKNAVDAGDFTAFPVGTEIPDTWNGKENPLIVGTYRIVEQNGKRYRAVGLTRKYADLKGQVFGSTADYSVSSILSYLNSTYLNNCSDSLKNAISEVKVPWYNGSQIIYVSGKVHIPSGVELVGTYNPGEGEAWEYWKNKTGLSAANNGANSGRIMRGLSNETAYLWTRSRYDTTNVAYVDLDGSIKTGPCNGNQAYTLPQFWILSTKPIDDTPTGLQDALTNGTAETDYPIGTEISDTYDGNDNPLIVGTYQTITKDGERYRAVGLLRKYVEPVALVWSSTNSANYQNSDIFKFLNGDYLSKCSDSLKKVIAEVNTPWYNGSSIVQVSGKWQLFSGTEMWANPNTGEGQPWEYWTQQTGLTKPDDGDNAARIGYDRSGEAQPVWLRSWYSSSYVWYIGKSRGQLSHASSPNSSFGVRPYCWVLSAEPLPGPAAPTTIEELVEALNQDRDIVIGTEIKDTWNGGNNPLIVGTNTTINGKRAVGLVRKYLDGRNILWNSETYAGSNVLKWLNTTYLNACSDIVKQVVAESSVLVNEAGTLTSVSGKWHIFSGVEVGGTYNAGEGHFWEYYQEKLGTTTPNDAMNEARGATFRGGGYGSILYWLRSNYNNSTSQRRLVSNQYGQFSYATSVNAGSGFDVLAHCYVTAGSLPSAPTTYTVTFDANGGTPTPEPQEVKEGELASEPTVTQAGYNFLGWYKDGVKFNFSTPITANITLVAQWEKVYDAVPFEYKITGSGSRYTVEIKFEDMSVFDGCRVEWYLSAATGQTVTWNSTAMTWSNAYYVNNVHQEFDVIRADGTQLLAFSQAGGDGQYNGFVAIQAYDKSGNPSHRYSIPNWVSNSEYLPINKIS